MTKEESLNSDFLKDFKNGEEFSDFISQLYKRGIEAMLEGELKYVVWKDKKEFHSDMKNIYTAPNREASEIELIAFEKKWSSKYAYAAQSWRKNWDNLTVFFYFHVEIRKIIYTTNLIENLNGKIRKYTKNKLSFPTDMALKKSVYLAINEITKKWTQPIRNWALIFNQFITIFENRIQL